MEVSLQVQSPLSYKAVFNHKTECFKIKPFLGSFPFARTSLFTPWRCECPASRLSHRVTASAADFSKRRQRRSSNPSSKGPSSKGFTPKTQVGTTTQKRDQKSNDEKEDSSISRSSETAEPNKTEIESDIALEEESTIKLYQKKKVDESVMEEPEEGIPLRGKDLAVGNQNVEIGSTTKILEDVAGLSKKEPILKNDIVSAESDVVSEGKHFGGAKIDDTVTVKDESISSDEKTIEDTSLKLKLEMEADLRRQEIEGLAEDNSSKGNKIFVYPQIVKPDQDIEVFFNRSFSTLKDEPDVLIMGAFNDWRWRSFTTRLNKNHLNGDWWSCQIHVPKEAYKMDFVFFNGQNVYDNNDRKDFCVLVEGGMDAFAFEDFLLEEKRRELEKIAKEQAEKERQEEEQRRIEAEKAANEADRAQARVETERRREILRQLMEKAARSADNIWFIEPNEFKGAEKVKLYYNKSSGPLAHANELWIHGGHNNWNDGLTIVEKLVRSDREDGDWWYAEVKVPLDAYMMDFVFSEREDGGIFDNKGGMDYHIPVFGGIVKEPPMNIVHIAVEMAPIAKVGGLGDVVTSLSRAVQDLNHNVDIILPKYDCLNLSHDLHYQRSYSWSGTEIKVWFGKVEGLPVYFLEPQNGFFWTGCVYGCRNDGERFGFFCHAALEFLHQGGFHPDIIHCHDWSSAPVAWLFKDQYMHYGLSKTRVVFTIHNLEFGSDLIGKAMQFADKATTVSHTYSREVAGNPAIAPHLHKFHGILNGIDLDIWDPYKDKFIPISYTSENVVEGKRAAKEALQQRLGLKKDDLPLVGIITRLTHQKGIHLIKHAIGRTLERNGQVVLLGSAPDPRIQNDFVNLANQLHSSHGDRARLCLTYDEPLSHLIYAGADFILVPSIFEPCGLTQLTAMRYGSIPVVRKTGGLYDTVFDVDNDKERAEAQGLEPNGFNFDGADIGGVDYALNRAISAWYDGREWFHSLCKRVMEQDWSWNRPALDYMELYHAARKY
ncbi:hypothetical protein PTKIN_Ptkin18bG0144400 [Pterospermum kingtungense]